MLRRELEQVASAVAGDLGPGEQLTGVLPTEPAPGRRVYLCSFEGPAGRTWLAVDAEGRPILERTRVREAASIAALCELAEDSAGGGRVDELRSQLVALRLTEAPEGIDEAEDAALALQRAILPPLRLATPEYLDGLGVAARQLEEALGHGPGSPFVESMKQGAAVVDELMHEIESAYRAELDD